MEIGHTSLYSVISDCVYMDLSIPVMIRFFKYLVFVFVYVKNISRFKKPDYAGLSLPKGTFTCIHLIPFSDRCLLTAQVRLQPSDVTETQTVATMRASHLWSQSLVCR